MTTLANSTAEALGYSVGAAFDPHDDDLDGGPQLLVRSQPATAPTGADYGTEVRHARFDVRYVLRDFAGGAGMAEDFGAGAHTDVKRASNPSTLKAESWGVEPTLPDARFGRWDEGNVLPTGMESAL